MATNQSRKVPTGKLARLTSISGLAGTVVRNVIADKVKDFSKGDARSLSSLVMQPKNIQALADKLSHLRGAAMKLGQMISMDAGELLPPELSVLLEKLRSNATPMPHKQLVKVLEQQLGEHWLDHYSHFDLRPFAAASIGQVHNATLVDGTKVAVKVQYPGIAQSIESDVDNVSSLLALSRIIPAEVDLKATLEEVKLQLKLEADYLLEAKHLADFKIALQHNPIFKVPTVYPKASSKHLITMAYLPGIDIATCTDLNADERNRIVSQLLVLFFEELFEFCQMQSDPNFANYLYDTKDKTIVLLDFGATRSIPTSISNGYRQLLSAAYLNDRDAVIKAAQGIGFFQEDITDQQINTVIEMFMLATVPLRSDIEFDFGASDLAQQIKEMGMQLSFKQGYWHTPPVDAMFIHRKLAGLYLMAAKLNAKINVNALFEPYLLTEINE